MKTLKLSYRQTTILNAIRTSVVEHGFPPSIREIGEAVGLSSSSTVHSHLKTLENKGVLRRNPSKPRSIELIDRPVPASPVAIHHKNIFDHVRGLRDDLAPAAAAPATIHEFNTPEQAAIANIKAKATVEAYQKVLEYLASVSPLGGLQ